MPVVGDERFGGRLGESIDGDESDADRKEKKSSVVIVYVARPCGVMDFGQMRALIHTHALALQL